MSRLVRDQGVGRSQDQPAYAGRSLGEQALLGLAELPPAMRRNLLWESAYYVGNGVVTGLMLLAQVTVIGSLGGGAAEVTLITAAMPASSLVQPLWASAARLYRLQTLALVSGALRCGPLFLIGLVDHPGWFTLLVVGFYFLAGPLALAVPSLYKYNYADSHRGRIIGYFRLIQNGIAIPVMLGCALLFDRHPDWYRIVYPLGGGLGLIGLWFYGRLRVVDDDPRARAVRSERPTWRSIRAVLRTDEHFRLFQLTIFLTGAGFLMSRAIWVYLLHERFELSQVQLTFLVMVLPIVLGALTSPAWGALIDRTSPVAGRVAFAWLGIFAYAALFASFAADLLWLAWAGAILRGLVLGAAEVATTAGNLYFSLRPERAALYESISSVFQGVRGLSMPLLGWALFRHTPIGAGIFLVPTVLNLWSLRLALKLWRMDRAAARRRIDQEVIVGDEVEVEA